jgi:hypothetical protein
MAGADDYNHLKIKKQNLNRIRRQPNRLPRQQKYLCYTLILLPDYIELIETMTLTILLSLSVKGNTRISSVWLF